MLITIRKKTHKITFNQLYRGKRYIVVKGIMQHPIKHTIKITEKEYKEIRKRNKETDYLTINKKPYTFSKAEGNFYLQAMRGNNV